MSWYARSAPLYDAPESRLPAIARRARRGEVDAVAHFVAETMGQLRGQPVSAAPSARLARLLTAKYAAAGVGGVLGLSAGPLGLVGGFYAVEAQMVFLAPVLLDHPTLTDREILARCRQLTGRLGTSSTMAEVLPIAARMLFGGLLDGDPLRAWSLGAIAVVLWYEEVRGMEPCGTGSSNLLEVGGHGPLVVRQESLDRGLGLRVLHASDLHLANRARSAWVVEGIVRAAREVDLVLLGGDLLDRASGVALLSDLVRRCPRVWAIGGNHDRWFGTRSRRAVEQGGGVWLERKRSLGDLTVHIDAHDPSDEHGLLLVHAPKEVRGARGHFAALAGHLHGGQVVLSERGGRQWPAALFWPRCGPRVRTDGLTLFGNRGASDTLPLRLRCAREVIELSI